MNHAEYLMFFFVRITTEYKLVSFAIILIFIYVNHDLKNSILYSLSFKPRVSYVPLNCAYVYFMRFLSLRGNSDVASGQVAREDKESGLRTGDSESPTSRFRSFFIFALTRHRWYLYVCTYRKPLTNVICRKIARG